MPEGHNVGEERIRQYMPRGLKGYDNNQLPSGHLFPRCSCPFGAPSGIYCKERVVVAPKGQSSLCPPKGERESHCPKGATTKGVLALAPKGLILPKGVSFQPFGHILPKGLKGGLPILGFAKRRRVLSRAARQHVPFRLSPLGGVYWQLPLRGKSQRNDVAPPAIYAQRGYVVNWLCQ